MNYYAKIKLKVGGVEVEAETVFARPSEFSLRLIKPEFEARFYSSHIMYMALGHHRFFERDGQISEYGLQTANAMIVGLYKGYLLVQKYLIKLDKKADELVELNFHIKQELAETINKLNLIRSFCKQKFKNGEIDEKEYLQNRKAIDKKKGELNEKYIEDRKTAIYKGLSAINPSFIPSGDKSSCYTAESALRSYFWNLINKKSEEFEKNQKQ